LELDARLGIQQANFLPYHSMGKTKWEQLHKTYLYDFPMMDPAQLTPYIELGKQYHVEVKIGG
jgi:pyruvate formate lyase activating enzyme